MRVHLRLLLGSSKRPSKKSIKLCSEKSTPRVPHTESYDMKSRDSWLSSPYIRISIRVEKGGLSLRKKPDWESTFGDIFLWHNLFPTLSAHTAQRERRRIYFFPIDWSLRDEVELVKNLSISLPGGEAMNDPIAVREILI